MGNKDTKNMVSDDTTDSSKAVRTAPMTTAELFQTVYGILEEKGMLPDILDYGLPAHNPDAIKTYDYELKNSLQYGGSEGIYLDLWIEYHEDKQKRGSSLGTFKTLDEGREAMHAMAGLLADFIVEEHGYVNSHCDDFTWVGVNVYGVNETGERTRWCYTCGDMDSALQKKDELLKKYPCVAVKDNATRKQTEYRNS